MMRMSTSRGPILDVCQEGDLKVTVVIATGRHRLMTEAELYAHLGAHGANILAKPIVEKNARVILVTCDEVARKLEGTYLTAVTDLGDAWQIANSVAGSDASVLFIEKARRLISVIR
jgi:hypothetical protein